jgi:hypothetical protein
MRKIAVLFLLSTYVTLGFSQQNNEPVYVNGLFLGPYVCGFAENNLAYEYMKELEPFIKNRRLYFLCAGIPVNSGNLKPGVEFALSEAHSVLAKYQGTRTDFVNSDHALLVAGFAEIGKITVTDVFLDEKALEQWAATVKFAYDY